MTEPAIKMALEYEKYFRENPELRREYELREMAELDRRSELDLNRQEGIREGIQSEKIQNAINFLKLGIDIETVAKGVNLSIEKIKELQKSIL